MSIYKLMMATVMVWGMMATTGWACEPGDPRSPSYMRRDNNRCEGVVQRFDVSGSFRLISFTSRSINDSYGNTLLIQVPDSAQRDTPEVVVRSPRYRYQLDELALQANGNTYDFPLDTRVLREVNIPPNYLRATAVTGVQEVYVPVILGSPNRVYEFGFYAAAEAELTQLTIRGRTTDYEQTLTTPYPRQGEVVFTWDGRNAPTGEYELEYTVSLRQRSSAPEVFTRRILFDHNPSWLR